MNARVVYEGDGDYEGTLFNGLKLWVAAQVPMRESLIKRIKSNGGKIVILEKHADIKIADHLHQKHAPEGSVSWKWIDACIKEGDTCDIEEYKIIKTLTSGRPGVSSAGRKAGRTPYTEADKRILVRWVVQNTPAGERTLGNAIYDQLAARYPHHTSQSWRDHWKKNYDHIPRNSLPYLRDPDSPPAPTARQSSVNQPAPVVAQLPTRTISASPSMPPPRQANAPLAARLPTRTISASPSIPPPRQVNAPEKRVPFSDEDDRILRRHVFDRVLGGEKALGNKIYKELEEEYPNHSFQSWLDRSKRLGIAQEATDFFMTGNRPRVPIMDFDADEPAPRASVPATARVANRSRSVIDLNADELAPRASVPVTARPRYEPVRISADTEEFIRGQQKERAAARARSRTIEEPNLAARAPSRVAREPVIPARSSGPAKLTLGKKTKLVRAAKLIQRVWRGYRVRRELYKEQEEDDYEEDRHEQEGHQDDHQEDIEEDDEADDDVEDEVEDEADNEADEEDDRQEADELDANQDDQGGQDDQDDQNHQDNQDSHDNQDDHHEPRHQQTPLLSPQPYSKTATPRQTSQVAAVRIKSEPSETIRLPSTRKAPTAEEVKFYEMLLRFYQHEGMPPIKTVDICVAEPMVLPLWELWSRATQDHSLHECRDWEDIATALGIDWLKFPDVTNQLKFAFDKHLRGYEVMLKNFREMSRDEDESESDQDESSSDENNTEAAPPPASSPLKGPHLPSSPPIAGLKRTHEDPPEASALGPSTKRRRFNRDDEIPCSPSVDSRVDRPTMQLDSSPRLLPFLPRAQKKVIEPETQDFNFDKMDDDPLELTPSNQLLSEMTQPEDRSPVSDSSDAFEPPVNQPRPGPAPTARSFTGGRQEPPRRVLPPSYSKAPTSNKPPAIANQQPVGSHKRFPASMSPAVQVQPTAQLHPEYALAVQRLRETSRASTPASSTDRRLRKASTPTSFTGRHPWETPRVTSPPPRTIAFTKYPPDWPTTVDHFMSLGYPEEIVRTALEATTFVTGEAAQLMERLKKGKGIPKNVPGVWTDEDNEGLLLLDSAARGDIKWEDFETMKKVMDEQARVVGKHGRDRVLKRTGCLGLKMWWV